MHGNIHDVFWTKGRGFLVDTAMGLGWTFDLADFFEDNHPMMLLGPFLTINKDSYAFALQVLPHDWIHGLFWRGPSPRAKPGEEDGWYLEFLDNDKDFYSVMMEGGVSETDGSTTA